MNGKFVNPLLKGSALENLDGQGFISQFVPKAVGLVFVFGGVVFFFMLVWGAISWILSGGDKAHLESAKGKITNAIVGIVLLVGSFAIIKLLQAFFGVHILSIDIGPLVIQ
jgi:hypothetical protein